MEILESFLQSLKLALPTAVALAIVLIVLFVVRYTIDKRYAGAPGNRFRRQVITLILSFAGLLAIIMVLPISDSTRGQLLGLIGILLSAAIALSSATLIGNAMAGFMLRAVRNFRPGDFIQVGDHFGRVSEQGLFHVEIQTEDRDLTTVPNLYLTSNPVRVIRSSGTIISAEVSLGYNLPRTRIRELLLEAARETGLEDPFVHIPKLGDYAVTYRVAGMLSEVKHILSTRSRLREIMLDKLHRGGIEIVSPTFMNTRAIAEGKQFIPPMGELSVAPSASAAPEKMVFDKAEQAESLEKLREAFESAGLEIEEIKKQRQETDDESIRQKLQSQQQILEEKQKRIGDVIKWREEKDKSTKD